MHCELLAGSGNVGHVADACSLLGEGGEESEPDHSMEHDYAQDPLCKRLHATFNLLTLQVKAAPCTLRLLTGGMGCRLSWEGQLAAPSLWTGLHGLHVG
jgi:hypothetical protein